ncbi:MAG: cell division protein ZipA [Pseudomonadota bacterium]
MDIKDFILIVGGTLIAAVIAHGFWTAWRSQREPLRLDIVPELIPDDVDEMDRFRGELPNGGARPVAPEQGSFDLDDAQAQSAADRELFGGDEPAIARRADRARTRSRPYPKGPDLFTIPEGYGHDEDPVADPAIGTAPSEVSEPTDASASTAAAMDAQQSVSAADHGEEAPAQQAASTEPRRPRVAEVELPAPEADAEPGAGHVPEASPLITESRRELRPRRTPPASTRSTHRPRRLGSLRAAANDPLTEREHGGMSADADADVSSASNPPTGEDLDAAAEQAAEKPVEELVLIHLVARRGETFAGDALCSALRERGLKFGAMNIFHRVDPLTKAPLYSVANAVEPGFFDLSDLSRMSTPGVTFFLQLPGPDNPSQAMNDMLEVAQAVAHKLGGELRDEAKNRLTRQTASHMQQRVSDFALKQLSRRAL